VRTIEKGDQRDGDLDEALAILARHEALERTRADAEAWTVKAKDAIGLLPAHPVRDMLSNLADYVVARLA
jgi:octaprenyl-diphosphate synthase